MTIMEMDGDSENSSGKFTEVVKDKLNDWCCGISSRQQQQEDQEEKKISSREEREAHLKKITSIEQDPTAKKWLYFLLVIVSSISVFGFIFGSI